MAPLVSIPRAATTIIEKTNVGSFYGDIIRGQGPTCGVLTYGHYLGPGAEMKGPFMGTLLGARGQNVGSLHMGIIHGDLGPVGFFMGT